MKKLLLIWILALAAFFLLLEFCARLLVAPPEPQIMEDARRSIRTAGVLDLEDAMAFHPGLFWVLRPGLRDYRVTGSLDGYAIDFAFSSGAGVRGLRYAALDDGRAVGQDTTRHIQDSQA